MVRVFVTRVVEVSEEEMEGFSDYRKEKIRNKQQEKSRIQSMTAGLLLKEVLSRYGIDAKNERKGRTGKPEVDGIYFNLSHSGDVVVCAAGEREVGCDVEMLKEISPRVVRRCLTEKEQSHIESLTGIQRRDEIIRIWTMKESYVKMTGEGIAVDFRELGVISDGKDQVTRKGKRESCKLTTRKYDNYQIAVCTEDEEITFEYMDLTAYQR